jgi:hypothetical protein
MFKMFASVLAASPTPALTKKHVSRRLNKFQLGLQFVTKQNYSFLLGNAIFETHYKIVSPSIQILYVALSHITRFT